jgi:transposase
MSYKQPRDRNDALLLPPALCDYISKDNPVIAIDAYVDSLDLVKLGFEHVKSWQDSHRGQPAFHARELLKLYIYGYLNHVRSSRRLEREASRNIELMWLIGDLKPSYKTIADFRKRHFEGLKAVNVDFMMLCKGLQLFGGECVAIDGSFFKANASKKSIKRKQQLEEELKRIEQYIEHYYSELSNQDHAEDAEGFQSLTIDESLATKINQLIEQKTKHQGMLNHLAKTGDKQYSRTDADARLLNKSTGTVAGYNIQSVVDDKHCLIVHSEVGNTGDLGQLATLAKKAKEILEVEQVEVLADKGYFKQKDIIECEQHNIDAYVPRPDCINKTDKADRLKKTDFTFDPETNSYICPANQRLVWHSKFRRDSIWNYIYGSKASICKDCDKKEHCLPKHTKIRVVSRTEYESQMEQYAKKLEKHPEKMRKRSGMVEHPFGTIKLRAGWQHFLVRGFDKVSGEWGLMALCYNLTRVINILGIEQVIECFTNRRKIQPA